MRRLFGPQGILRPNPDPDPEPEPDLKEFKTTWLGNKAVYRTRLAMETGEADTLTLTLTLHLNLDLIFTRW